MGKKERKECNRQYPLTQKGKNWSSKAMKKKKKVTREREREMGTREMD